MMIRKRRERRGRQNSVPSVETIVYKSCIMFIVQLFISNYLLLIFRARPPTVRLSLLFIMA